MSEELPHEYACAVIVRDGRVLLGLRSPHRRRDAGRWDVIGGRVEAGETIEAALMRELGEELGIAPGVAIRLGTIPAPPSPSLPPAFYHFFAVHAWTGDPAMRGDEHTELRWFTPEDCAAEPMLALPDYLPVIARAVAAARG